MRALTLCLLALSVAGCTQTASTPAARPALPEPAYAPSGPGCGPQIAHFREIITYDLSVRRLAQSTFDAAGVPLAQAEAACAAGRSGEAMATLRRAKTAAGYP